MFSSLFYKGVLMDEPDTPHGGIELDLMDLSVLNRDTPSDPGDYRLFVNSIFKKMAAQDLFLAFSRQINDVNKILNTQYSSANDIAQVILKDQALTSKMLKLVNSSFYRNFSRKGISTISEAMILLGADEIRMAAAGLKIYETMKGLANIGLLAEKSLKGLQRGTMARQIAIEGGYKDPDALQVSAMMYDLGEYLVILFAPDKYIRIEIAMDKGMACQQEASKSILGISYSDLGRLAALKLHMPENIVYAMRPVNRFDLKADQMTPRDLHRYVTAFTKELCDLSREQEDFQAGSIAAKFKMVLNIEEKKALDLLHTSRDKIESIRS